jgi:hypothetical protein
MAGSLRSSPRTAAVFGAVIGLFVLIASLVGVADSIRGLAYTAGSAGTRGTLLVDDCVTRGSGKEQTITCYGVFTAATGGFTDPQASIGTQEDTGSRIAVREDQATGVCFSQGAAPELAWVALLLISLEGLLLVGAAVVGTVGALRRRARREQPQATPSPARPKADGRQQRPPAPKRNAKSTDKRRAQAATRYRMKNQIRSNQQRKSRVPQPKVIVATFLSLPALAVLSLLVAGVAKIVG